MACRREGDIGQMERCIGHMAGSIGHFVRGIGQLACGIGHFTECIGIRTQFKMHTDYSGACLHTVEYKLIGDVVAVIERALLLMVLLRVLSGSIEITAAALMYKFNDLEKAFYINSMLALVGPVILVTTTGLALSGLTEKISLTRIICLFAGVILIVYSLKAK